MKNFVLLLCVLSFMMNVISCSKPSAKPILKIIVNSGDILRENTPVSIQLNSVPQAMLKEGLRLLEIRGTEKILTPIQIEAGNPPRLWWILDNATPVGHERVYQLFQGKSDTHRFANVLKSKMF